MMSYQFVADLPEQDDRVQQKTRGIIGNEVDNLTVAI